METGMLLTTLKGHTDYIYGIQLINDEKKLISTSADNTIKIWDISEVKTHSRASLPPTNEFVGYSTIIIFLVAVCSSASRV